MGFAQIILEEKWQREQKVTRVYVENAPSEYRNIFFAWLGKIFAILMTKHYLLLKKKGGGGSTNELTTSSLSKIKHVKYSHEYNERE